MNEPTKVDAGAVIAALTRQRNSVLDQLALADARIMELEKQIATLREKAEGKHGSTD